MNKRFPGRRCAEGFVARRPRSPFTTVGAPRSVLLLLTLLLLPLVMSAAESDAAPSPPRRLLAGTTVISGSGATFARVRLLRDARVSNVMYPHRKRGPTEDVTIEGDGRAVGVLLVRDTPLEPTLGDERVLLTGRFGTCDPPSCGAGHEVSNFQFPSKYPGTKGPRQHVISAGDYRLYLIADSSPVRITLRLSGIPGHTSIVPSLPASLDFGAPTQNPGSGASPFYYSAGASYESGVRGIALSTLFASAKSDAAFEWGKCGYWGPKPPPPQVGYGPHCSALTLVSHLGPAGRGTAANYQACRRTTLYDYDERQFPPKMGTERGLGGWISSTAAMTGVGFQAFFLDY
jgi:hypothetical protein